MNAGTNSVTLTANTGAITDGGDLGTDITGGTVALRTLDGTTGAIGAAGDEMSLAATSLTTDSSNSSSNQFLTEADTVDVTSMDAGLGNITVTAGTFLVSGTATAVNVNVESTAVWGGTGTVFGALNVATSGGTLAPGNSGPGILNATNVANPALNLDNDSTFAGQLNGTTAGTTYDQVNVTGMVDLNANSAPIAGATLALSFGFAPVPGNSFTIINNDAADPIAGTFTDPLTMTALTEGKSFFAGGVPLSISYVGGSGNDVVLSYNQTPEINADDFVFGTSFLQVIRNGANIEVRIDDDANLGIEPGDVTPAILILNTPIANLISLTINGQTASDTLTVDMSGGNPLPSGGISFGGDDGNDALEVVGGTASTLTYTPGPVGGGDDANGRLDFDGRAITFTGLEPLLVTTSVSTVTIDLSALTGSETLTVQDDTVTFGGAANDDMSEAVFTTTSLENLQFKNPTTLLRILGSTLADTINLNALDGKFDADVTLDAGAGADAFG